jgi:hypothetical protein
MTAEAKPMFIFGHTADDLFGYRGIACPVGTICDAIGANLGTDGSSAASKQARGDLAGPHLHTD